jgi:outer membrane protein, multidrug efflux system
MKPLKRIHTMRRAAPGVLVLAAALALAGCGSMIPAFKRPALPVAETYPLPTVAATGRALADTEWRAFFADPRLQRLIALALDSNRDLRVAALSIEQAAAQLQVRRADLLPTVGAGVTATRSAATGGQPGSVYSAGLQISAWELDLFGRIRSLSEAARAQLLASEETRRAVQVSLVAAVAQTHLSLQADEALLETTRQTLASREESLRLARLRFDNGVTSELDLRQAESLLEAARVVLAQQTRQRLLDQNTLVLLVGQPLPTDLPPLLPLDQSIEVAELPAGLPSDLLLRRPDIRAAEQQMMVADANIGAARAAFFPRISLTASAGVAATELSALFSGANLAWSFVPQLFAPIFDSGRNRAGLESARAAREIATAQYERAIQTAFREVSDALAGQATLSEQLRAQSAQLAAERARFRLADLRYRNGISSYLDVLDAQRSLYAAEQALVQTQILRAQNRVALYRAVGGGWNATPALTVSAGP